MYVGNSILNLMYKVALGQFFTEVLHFIFVLVVDGHALSAHSLQQCWAKQFHPMTQISFCHQGLSTLKVLIMSLILKYTKIG